MDENRKPENNLRRRILAGIAALLMIGLVLVYTYSLASGSIFAW